MDPFGEHQHQLSDIAYIWCCCRLELRSQLLETLRPFTFPGVTSLSQDILADVAHRFPDDPEAWDLRAHAAWHPVGKPPAALLPASSAQQQLQVKLMLACQCLSQTIQPHGCALTACSYRTCVHGIPLRMQDGLAYTSYTRSAPLVAFLRPGPSHGVLCPSARSPSSPDFNQRSNFQCCIQAQTSLHSWLGSAGFDARGQLAFNAASLNGSSQKAQRFLLESAHSPPWPLVMSCQRCTACGLVAS